MRDPDDLLRALESPDPPPVAPAWPEQRRSFPVRWVAGSAFVLAAAAAAAVFVLAPTDPEGPATRGFEPDDAILDLRMAVERGGVAERVASGATLNRGERVVFRITADRETSARLWVEQPDGRATIAETDAGPVPRDVGDGRGLVGYRFDSPGRHVFHLTPTDGACDDCPSVAVEVR